MCMPDWDERYGRGDYSSAEPSQLLRRAVTTLTPGLALDLACGVGRHAIFLAGLGWQVTAVDSSRTGIEIMKRRAAEAGATITSRIDAHIADLERGEFPIATESYDLICDFYYLQRNLFPQLRAGVKRGGTFVGSIHLVGNDPAEETRNPAFLLEPGELRAEFRGWEITHYHETQMNDDDPGKHHYRSAEIIATKK
ncbi:MAG: methyltransferase domain-containing protein [Pyrinomonadaceae bacterium]